MTQDLDNKVRLFNPGMALRGNMGPAARRWALQCPPGDVQRGQEDVVGVYGLDYPVSECRPDASLVPQV